MTRISKPLISVPAPLGRPDPESPRPSDEKSDSIERVGPGFGVHDTTDGQPIGVEIAALARWGSQTGIAFWPVCTHQPGAMTLRRAAHGVSAARPLMPSATFPQASGLRLKARRRGGAGSRLWVDDPREAVGGGGWGRRTWETRRCRIIDRQSIGNEAAFRVGVPTEAVGIPASALDGGSLGSGPRGPRLGTPESPVIAGRNLGVMCEAGGKPGRAAGSFQQASGDCDRYVRADR